MLTQLLSVSHLIPLLPTFLENVKSLEVGARILEKPLPARL